MPCTFNLRHRAAKVKEGRRNQLIIAAILYVKGGYPTGYAILAVPAVLSLIVLSVGRVLIDS